MIKYLRRRVYIKEVKSRIIKFKKMSDKKDVIFLKGTAKKKTFDNGGSILNHSINVEQVVQILEWVNEERAKRGLEPTVYLNLSTKERREADEYGNTHYTIYEPWFPEAKGGASKAPKSEATDKLPWE